MKTQKVVMDQRVSGHPAQSDSGKAQIFKELCEERNKTLPGI